MYIGVKLSRVMKDREYRSMTWNDPMFNPCHKELDVLTVKQGPAPMVASTIPLQTYMPQAPFHANRRGMNTLPR